jgi:hypothetical protein
MTRWSRATSNPRGYIENQCLRSPILDGLPTIKVRPSKVNTNEQQQAYQCNINQCRSACWKCAHERALGWMSDHFEPGIRKHYVSREGRSSKQDKQQEVKRKNDQSNDLDRRIAVPVRKCVNQGRCTPSAHDHCMPGPCKMPVVHRSGGYHGHAVARTVCILSMIYEEVPPAY